MSRNAEKANAQEGLTKRGGSYHYLPNIGGRWSPHYEVMYRSMVHALLSAGNTESQRVLIVGFNLDLNAAPPVAAYRPLLRLGAGEILQWWETHCRHGVQDDKYVTNPCYYLLVGGSAKGYGQGHEDFLHGEGPNAVEVSGTTSVHLTNPRQ